MSPTSSKQKVLILAFLAPLLLGAQAQDPQKPSLSSVQVTKDRGESGSRARQKLQKGKPSADVFATMPIQEAPVSIYEASPLTAPTLPPTTPSIVPPVFSEGDNPLANLEPITFTVPSFF